MSNFGITPEDLLEDGPHVDPNETASRLEKVGLVFVQMCYFYLEDISVKADRICAAMKRKVERFIVLPDFRESYRVQRLIVCCSERLCEFGEVRRIPGLGLRTMTL